MPEPTTTPRPVRKRKLMMVQVKVPKVALDDWKKGAEEFNHDNVSSLIRTAVQFYLRHQRKTAPDKLEGWAQAETKKNRAALRGVYNAIRLNTAAVVALSRQHYLRHGDPPQNEFAANMLRIDEFDELLEKDTGVIYQRDRSWFEGTTATEREPQVVEIAEVEE